MGTAWKPGRPSAKIDDRRLTYSKGRTMGGIRELLDEKGAQVWSIEPYAKVYAAVELMSDKRLVYL